MGISHTGVAYVKDGVRAQHRQPAERGVPGRPAAELNSEHYRTLQFIHVIRPRNLTEAAARQPAGLDDAAHRQRRARSIPSRSAFNQDYNAPKYKRGKPLEFVKHLGQIGARAEPAGHGRHVLLGVRLVAAVA